MVVGQTVHGAPGWQHRATHVVSLVTLQRVFCGRRTRRTALVIDRGSFIYICNDCGRGNKEVVIRNLSTDSDRRREEINSIIRDYDHKAVCGALDVCGANGTGRNQYLRGNSN